MDISHLQKDKKFAAIIELVGEITISKKKNVFIQLTRSIASQQLSVKAAATIFKRFLDLLLEPTPQAVLNLSMEQLRSVGFSTAKSTYVQNIASFWLQENITDKTFSPMEDAAIINYLTQIKGVGSWTVEMLLMFSLGRQNVFAVDDLGIQQAMCKLYQWDAADKKIMKEKMLQKSKVYAPTKTIACMYLWRWKDAEKNKIA